jgi:hypothetical protein
MPMAKAKRKHVVTVVQGTSGLAVYLNDIRIAGGKPFGGGRLIMEVLIDDDQLKEASAPAQAKSANEQHKLRLTAMAQAAK